MDLDERKSAQIRLVFYGGISCIFYIMAAVPTYCIDDQQTWDSNSTCPGHPYFGEQVTALFHYREYLLKELTLLFCLTFSICAVSTLNFIGSHTWCMVFHFHCIVFFFLMWSHLAIVLVIPLDINLMDIIFYIINKKGTACSIAPIWVDTNLQYMITSCFIYLAGFPLVYKIWKKLSQFSKICLFLKKRREYAPVSMSGHAAARSFSGYRQPRPDAPMIPLQSLRTIIENEHRQEESEQSESIGTSVHASIQANETEITRRIAVTSPSPPAYEECDTTNMEDTEGQASDGLQGQETMQRNNTEYNISKNTVPAYTELLSDQTDSIEEATMDPPPSYEDALRMSNCENENTPIDQEPASGQVIVENEEMVHDSE
ncbi:unnamed protein product [Caenorhabditis brenneri]